MKSKPTDRNVSLARALSKLGLCSRSEAMRMIASRRVKVNGQTVTNPSRRCSLESDRFQVDGSGITKKQLVYILMNKPAGIVTTKSDERGRPTVYDILGDVGSWVFPVGRLDKETTGLLLLTNDNRFGERLTSPRSNVVKIYIAELDRKMADDALSIIRHGMKLEGDQLLPAEVKPLDATRIELSLREGKNRQIRRMCKKLGYTVVKLERIAVGNLTLVGVPPGRWRHLKKDEVEVLSRRVVSSEYLSIKC